MSDKSQLTCVYAVGGDNAHYQNLFRSLRSLRERGPACEVLILDLGGRLKSENNIRIIPGEKLIDPLRQIAFQAWKLKYYACLYAETKYVFYLDTDTVLVNNTFETLIQRVRDGIGVTQHWFVQTMKDFYEKIVPAKNKELFLELLRTKFKVDGQCKFIAGGTFLFRNSLANQSVLKNVLSLHEEIYPPGVDYIEGLTDEVFFSAALKHQGAAVFLGGALNHCVMGNHCMPLKYHKKIFYGRNPFEKKWEPVTLFHCDTNRDNNYGWLMRSKIRKALYL